MTGRSFAGDDEMTAAPGTHEEMGALAVAEARDLVDRLRCRGFRATLDRGALLIGDTTGQWRDPFRFISPALVFDVLIRGLDEDPALLDPRNDEGDSSRIAILGALRRETRRP
jgi:hypothetical protein